MTKKLFWTQPYEKEFEATIIAIRKKGVVLNQTLFYPEGGGQASDRGILKARNLKFEVEHVFKKGKEIIHMIKSDFQDKLKIGEKVVGIIDWDYRYGLMKAHTSQHLISAVILKKFNIKTTRVNIDFENVSLSLGQIISYNQLKSALQEINEICTLQNYKIIGEIVPFEEAEKISNEVRGDIPKKGQIRLVRAENCDLVCCGGTHVQNSIEIGPLIIYSFKKGKDIRYFVGNRAIKVLSELNVDMLSSSDLLEQPITNITETIERQINIITKLQQENNNLAIEVLNLISENPILTINKFPIYILDLEIDSKIFNKEFKNFPLNSILIVNLSDNKFRVLSKCKDVIANEIVQYLLEKFGGRGGGSPRSAQCSLDNKPKDILKEIELFLNKK